MSDKNSIEEERKRNEALLASSIKQNTERKCFCDKTEEESSRQFIRKYIIQQFTENKDECQNNKYIAYIRPHAKEIDVIPFVDKEEYTDDVKFNACVLPINYCPYCGRKL